MIISLLLSSFLYYLSFPNIFSLHGFWPCAWFFAIPFFRVLDNQSIGKRLVIGFLWGLSAYGFSFNWIYSIHWLGWLLFILVATIQAVFFSLLFIPIRNNFLAILYYPAAWVVSEYLRALILGGFSWTIAHSQAYEPRLIQLATFTGSYGISFILIFVNTCIYQAIKEKENRKILLGLALGVFVLTAALGASYFNREQAGERKESTLRVCAVQPNISPLEKHSDSQLDENFLKHYDLSQACAARYQPQMILWPETSFTDDLQGSNLFDLLIEAAKVNGSAFLVGTALIADETNFNSAVFLKSNGRFGEIYHKQHLVPISEYAVFGKLSKMFGGYEFASGRKLGIFEISSQVNQKSIRFGAAICSEGGYPSLFRKLKKAGAAFSVLLLNDGWFKSPEALYMHASHEIMRAVEMRMPIVRESNTGLTCLISPLGQLDTRLAPAIYTEGYGVFDIPLKSYKSFYAEFGDFFAILAMVFVIIILIIDIKKKQLK